MRPLDAGLNDMSETLLQMADLAERTVEASLSSAAQGGKIDAQVRVWSNELQGRYDDVEEKAVELIARYQPVASDLRVIKSNMKIAYDLARLGRYAYDIVQVLDLIDGGKAADRAFLEKMSEQVLDMMRLSFQTLRTHDVQVARQLIEMDNGVDSLYRGYLRGLISNANLKAAEAVSTALVARHLERIADHAWYIAQSVSYMVTGTYIV
ncbi:MAG: phosphate signaling complex protein PhoU [Candidatus Bathyarchaeia archaeon]